MNAKQEVRLRLLAAALAAGPPTVDHLALIWREWTFQYETAVNERRGGVTHDSEVEYETLKLIVDAWGYAGITPREFDRMCCDAHLAILQLVEP